MKSVLGIAPDKKPPSPGPGGAATPSTEQAAGAGPAPSAHGTGGEGPESHRGEAAGPRGVAGEDHSGGWQRGLDRHGTEARWGWEGSDMIRREKTFTNDE